jgi:hypothetical protein
MRFERLQPYFFATVFLFGIVVAFFSFVPYAQAGADDSLSGWAWSENIGWISFNSTTDTASSVDYGVDLDIGTGNLSGYAWSEHIGWISFNIGELGGCPIAPCQPRMSGTLFEGWARACSGKRDDGVTTNPNPTTPNNVCIGTDSRTDGWDGWISLKGTGASTYGLQLFGNEVRGWAWGSTNVGWIDFHPIYNGQPIGGVYYDTEGNIKIYRVNSNGGLIGGTTAVLNNSQNTGNPAIFSQVVTGTHAAGVIQEAGTFTVAQCQYNVGDTECTASSFTGTPTCANNPTVGATVCSVPTTVIDGKVTKVVFKYSETGDVIIKRVGANGETASAPAASSRLSSGATIISTLTDNPALFEDYVGTHTMSATAVSGYVIDRGVCTYPRDHATITDCDISGTSTAAVSGGWASYTTNLQPERVTKVVFYYRSTAIDTDGDTIPDSEDPDDDGDGIDDEQDDDTGGNDGSGTDSCEPQRVASPELGRIRRIPASEQVKWVAIGQNDPDAIYTWTLDGEVVMSGGGLTTFPQILSQEGLRNMVLTVDADGVVSTHNCTDQSLNQSFRVTAPIQVRQF